MLSGGFVYEMFRLLFERVMVFGGLVCIAMILVMQMQEGGNKKGPTLRESPEALVAYIFAVICEALPLLDQPSSGWQFFDIDPKAEVMLIEAGVILALLGLYCLHRQKIRWSLSLIAGWLYAILAILGGTMQFFAAWKSNALVR